MSTIGENEARDGTGAFIATSGDALADFTDRALAFLEQHVPRRNTEPVSAGMDFLDRPVSLFSSRANELERIQRAKAWRAAKYDAGFGWVSGPTEYGGGGLPARLLPRMWASDGRRAAELQKSSMHCACTILRWSISPLALWSPQRIGAATICPRRISKLRMALGGAGSARDGPAGAGRAAQRRAPGGPERARNCARSA